MKHCFANAHLFAQKCAKELGKGRRVGSNLKNQSKETLIVSGLVKKISTLIFNTKLFWHF